MVNDWLTTHTVEHPIWVELVTWACYAALALAFLGIGHFLLSGRISLLKFGGAYALRATPNLPD
jgi:hypothetical protein